MLIHILLDINGFDTYLHLLSPSSILNIFLKLLPRLLPVTDTPSSTVVYNFAGL